MKPIDLTVTQLAQVAEVGDSWLWALARNPALRMKPVRKKMVRGKVRPIEAPYRQFRTIARRIHRFLQREFPPHHSVHGGAKSKSCVTSASRHLGKRVVLTRDISKCYPSITTEMMYVAIRRMDYRPSVSRLLAKLMTTAYWIPHGSPLSADALNYYFAQLDEEITQFCRRRGLSNTRTYDDFAISGNDIHNCRLAGILLERRFKDRGLVVNERKKRRYGFQWHHNEQLVHNLIVNKPTGTKLPAKQHAKAVRMAEQLVRGVKVMSPESLLPLARKRNSVTGWMYYCRQLQYSPARHLKRLVKQADRIVLQKLATIGISAHKGKWWVIVKKGRNEPQRLAAIWKRNVETESPCTAA